MFIIQNSWLSLVLVCILLSCILISRNGLYTSWDFEVDLWRVTGRCEDLDFIVDHINQLLIYPNFPGHGLLNSLTQSLTTLLGFI